MDERAAAKLVAQQIRTAVAIYESQLSVGDHCDILLFAESLEKGQARASLIGQPPEGWKLVPIEPTDEMIDAFCNTPKMKVIDGMIATAQIRGGYADARLSCETKQDSAVGEGLKAALAAAPQPTVSNKIDKPD